MWYNSSVICISISLFKEARVKTRGLPAAVLLTAAVPAIIVFMAGCTSKPAERKIRTVTAPPAARIDTTVLKEVPDPLSGDNPVFPQPTLGVPDAGASFADPQFATTLTRVTDSPGSRHEYSRFDPFNADRSMIILLDPEGGFIVYATAAPYNRNKNLVLKLDVEEPRWDREDPQALTGFSGFKIISVNVTTGKKSVVKDFAKDPVVGPIIKAEPDLYRITMKDEGEPSNDGDLWAFALQGSKFDYALRYIVCWDRKRDKTLGTRKLAEDERAIDWVGMSPLGRWVVIGGAPENGGELAGLVIADRKLNAFHRLDYATAHADLGLDTDGNEVIVMQNARTDYIDLIPLDKSVEPIMENGGSYDGTGHIRLVGLFYNNSSPIGFNSGVHISGNCPGYAVISTYIEPGKPEQNWLDRSIILVRLDRKNPQAWYLAKTHNSTADYWQETHAAITNDGSRVVWSSNWDREGQNATFLLELATPMRQR